MIPTWNEFTWATFLYGATGYDSVYQDLMKKNFDRIIIPTNGNIDGYENVLLFSIKMFSCRDILFHIFPSKFIKNNGNLSSSIKNFLFKTIAVLALPFFLLVYFLIIIFHLFLTPFKAIEQSDAP